MAIREFWIQLENHPWDACPNNIDRITGEAIALDPMIGPSKTGKAPETKHLVSPGTGVETEREMFMPLAEDALILRRYKPPVRPDQSDAWTVPDDRKVNPWDLNEPDPTDTGTMGTIPGPVIECEVGDQVIVHFRNMDMRKRLTTSTKEICLPVPFGRDICFPFPFITQELIEVEKRTHSLHPHGFVFSPMHDGAYPLSPPDPNQPIAALEAALWSSIGVTGFKKGDRVPPGGTFDYVWNTFGWPTTAGVWLYHDHSICDMENVKLGAIGIIVIHNRADQDNVIEQDLPGGQFNGALVRFRCFPFPFPVPVLPHDLDGLGLLKHTSHGSHTRRLHAGEHANEKNLALKKKDRRPSHLHNEHEQPSHGEHEEPRHDDEPIPELSVQRGNLILELAKDFKTFSRICMRFYADPPQKALYLQLYHELPGVGMCINGRKHLGNTPTLLAGTTTKMRFGVVGMNDFTFHTFHLHGHRWVIAGPQGNDPTAIQNSAQVQAVSQFEDTRIFGPANSFGFTINQGSFMGSVLPPQAPGVGEWHMHCHVLGHMMDGMMGSLLVINGGEFAGPLPVGVPCPGMHAPVDGGGNHNGGGGPQTLEIIVQGFTFPASVTVNRGDSVVFKNNDTDAHSIVWDTPGPANEPAFAPGNSSSPILMDTAGTFNYHCGIHPGMTGSITVNP